MYRVVSCLTDDHDYWLLCLVVVVCVATALTAFLMYSVALECTGRRKVIWAAFAGVSGGAGIWATHFVAMLAYKGALPTHYDPVLTIGSLLIAIAIASAGFAISTAPGSWWRYLGGAIIGAAIGSMHFVGMQALVIPGVVVWDGQLVVASLLLGTAISTFSMVSFDREDKTRAIACSAVVLAIAICVLHFTAMGAVTIQPDPLVYFEDVGLHRWHLALAVASISFVVLLSTVAAALLQKANLRYAAELHDQNAIFEAALTHLPVGISMYDRKQRLIICNPAYRKLYNLSDAMMCPGEKYTDILARVIQRPEAEGVSFSVGQRLLKSGNKGGFSETIQLDDGRTILKKVAPTKTGGWVDVHEDVTERLQREARISYMAEHDLLTELPNRGKILGHVERALKERAPNEWVVLLFLDLDRFKAVNDEFGHLMGDKLLKAAAARLRETVRGNSLVARLGGDEFVVLLVSSLPMVETAEIASRIVAEVGAPYSIDGRDLDIGVSIGIAFSNERTESARDLLGRADTALYKTKAVGGGGFSFYGDEGKVASLANARSIFTTSTTG